MQNIKVFFFPAGENKYPHLRAIILIILLALLTRFIFFGWPKTGVLDEIAYFSYFSSSYLTGEFYFDQHPPLAKLIVGAFIALFNVTPIPPGLQWNMAYTNNEYLFFRFLPCLFGAILPIIGYALGWQLFKRRPLALFCGLLFIFDNALITQSRVYFIDMFLLVFGFTAILCYLHYRDNLTGKWLIGFASFAGLAYSVKWTGITFLALPILIESIYFILGRRSLTKVFKLATIATALSLGLYLLIFVSHLLLLPNSGKGDAYMSHEFQKTLVNSSYANDANIKPLSLAGKVKELNWQMYDANRRLSGATHPYASKWYQWPINEKAMSYWRNADGTVDIKAKGNPSIWLTGSLSMLIILFALIVKPSLWQDKNLPLIFFGYLSNWLPFALINRPMFIYHYLVSMLFSVLAICWLLNWLGAKSNPLSTPNKLTACLVTGQNNLASSSIYQIFWLLIPVLAGFIYVIPETYGFPAF